MRFKRSNISWYAFEPTSHCLLLDHDTDQNLNWMPIPSNLGRNSPKNNHPESEPAFLPCARAHVARTTTACSPRWRNNQRVQNQQRRCTRFFQMWKRFHFTLAQRMTKILNTCWAHFEGWVCSWSIRSMSRQNCQTCQTFPSSSPAHCSMLCWLFETSTSTFTMSIHLKPFRYCRLCHWVLEWLKVGNLSSHHPCKIRERMPVVGNFKKAWPCFWAKMRVPHTQTPKICRCWGDPDLHQWRLNQGFQLASDRFPEDKRESKNDGLWFD